MLQHAVISRGVLQHALWPRQGEQRPRAPSTAQWQVERNRALEAERDYTELFYGAQEALTLLRGAGRDPALRRWAVDQAIMNLEAAGVVPIEAEPSPSA